LANFTSGHSEHNGHSSNWQTSGLLTFAAMLFPDQSTTEHFGQIKAELSKLGKPIPDNDLWIAAIARQHGLPVATRDAHFTHVPGLQTLSW
jgi:tRNA(fMet)-specific endonuclease VapC